ncbi:adrenocortical dysplasia protein homolog isoform X2 [Physeter macrocephalus]|uniref:Adrenocortical dysplasia protein homolog isoform X2 n=1 Tax=Physeter macrocephalus TaxID=9755 RepID=A0A2Y9SRS1_PHYMC|nr:adrenocortical dysplasia protein homolog isoform X2 [Physeter catodon]|eukprot:XP_023980898.1 adrenocortical dysplasia protein homolog isoform X2 [Physeter catodon]
MAGLGSLVLRPWIRELVLGSEALSSPRAGQLLKGGEGVRLSRGRRPAAATAKLRGPRPSRRGRRALGVLPPGGPLQPPAHGAAPGTGDWLVSDASTLQLYSPPRPGWRWHRPWAPSYIDCLLLLLPSNQDPDVRKKLYDCLEEHLSESTSPSAGLSLSQLLDEVEEDQEHRGALVSLAESCLMLAGPCTAPPLTRWAASRCRATGEAVYSVPSLWLHISENDQQILSSLGPGQRAQGPELPPPHPALQDLSLTLISSPPSSPSSSGTPALPSHMLSEESGASISLLPALPLAAPDPAQKGSSQPLSATCSAHGPLPPSSLHPSHVPNSPPLSCTPSLSPLGHVPSLHQAHVTMAQRPSLEFKELGLPPKTWQHSPRTRTTKGALESSPVWDPAKRHRDGSAFQYEYEPPCPSLCAQVQAARLPPQLVAWALHFLMEPQPEAELTQV